MTDRKEGSVDDPERTGAQGSVDQQGWSSKRDHVRNIIRDEVYRMNPIDEARRSLELIVEASARYEDIDGQVEIVVVDDQGHPREAVKDGEIHAFSVRDLLEELRVKHPRLFRSDGNSGSSSHEKEGPRRASETATAPRDILNVAQPDATASGPAQEMWPPASHQRDWLNIVDMSVEPKSLNEALNPQGTGLAREPVAAEEPRAAVVSKLQRLNAERQSAPEAALMRQASPAAGALEPRQDLSRVADPTPLSVSVTPLDYRPENGSEVPPSLARRAMVALGSLAGVLILIIAAFLAYASWTGQISKIPSVASNTALPSEPPSQEPDTTTSLGWNQGAEPSPNPTPPPAPMLNAGPAPNPPSNPSPSSTPSSTPSSSPSPSPNSSSGLSSTQNAAAAPSVPPTSQTAVRPDETLRGVPQVLDTATLFLDGKIIQLFGVEWVRGAGTPEDLTRYLRGREVVCQATTTPDSYRCAVDNQDLSKVVLFNGGGRANADVPPELKAAETAARQARRGLWAKGVATSNP